MRIFLLTLALLVSAVSPVMAAGAGVKAPKQEWSFEGVRGDWNLEQILNGYTVATQVCLACHSFKYISHRDFTRLGFSEDQAKVLAADFGVELNDKLVSALSAEDSQATYGKIVPDLSVMTKARPDGVNYVFALLTGYKQAPAGFEVAEGGYYNEYFPGHVIAMPAPLVSDGMVTYRDGSSPTIEQMARDVTAFMAWTAEPERVDRQRMGVYVLLYLIILSVLLYFYKRRIWKDVK